LVLYLFCCNNSAKSQLNNVRFSVSIDILFAQKGAKLLPPDPFPGLNNAFAAPLGELTALPRPPSWIWRREREGRGRKGRERKGRERGKDGKRKRKGRGKG